MSQCAPQVHQEPLAAGICCWHTLPTGKNPGEYLSSHPDWWAVQDEEGALMMVQGSDPSWSLHMRTCCLWPAWGTGQNWGKKQCQGVSLLPLGQQVRPPLAHGWDCSDIFHFPEAPAGAFREQQAGKAGSSQQ